MRIRRLGVHRLCVHRTPKHIYAQIIEPNGDKVSVAASTLEKDLQGLMQYTGNIDAAKNGWQSDC